MRRVGPYYLEKFTPTVDIRPYTKAGEYVFSYKAVSGWLWWRKSKQCSITLMTHDSVFWYVKATGEPMPHPDERDLTSAVRQYEYDDERWRVLHLRHRQLGSQEAAQRVAAALSSDAR